MFQAYYQAHLYAGAFFEPAVSEPQRERRLGANLPAHPPLLNLAHAYHRFDSQSPAIRGAERNVQPPVLKSLVLPIPSQQVDVVSRRAVQSKARVVSGKSFEILYSLKANDWPFGNVSM